jgi:hypothetical protein
LEDIGGMKIHVIVQSGSKLKDFVDVYDLLERFSMNQLVSFYEDKYPEANGILAANSLLYFNDVNFEIPVKLTNGELEFAEPEMSRHCSCLGSTRAIRVVIGRASKCVDGVLSKSEIVTATRFTHGMERDKVNCIC